MRASWTRFLVVALAILLTGASAFSDEPDVPDVLKPGETAKQLEQPLASVWIEGNRLTPVAEILKLIKTRAGRMMSPAAVSADVTKLMDTGRYSDVTPELRHSIRGPVLVFVVKEQVIVKSITWIGNRRFTDEYLSWMSKVAGLSAGGTCAEGAVVGLAAKIEGAYQSAGYGLASRKVPIEEVLPAVLDRLWLDVLRDSFETAFSRLAGPEPPRTGPIERVEVVRPSDILR